MKRNTIINSALVFLSIFFTLVLSDVAARIYATVINKQRISGYDEVIGWNLIANTRSIERKETEYLVEINSKGLRDKEYAYKKPDNISRIVAMGDSFVFGFGGVDHASLFTEVAESNLENTQLINMGIPAFSTDQEFLYLQREGIRYQPDVVALFMFQNDFEFSFKSFDSTASKPKGYVRESSGELVFYPPSPSIFYEISHYSYLMGFVERKLHLERHFYKRKESDIDKTERTKTFRQLLIAMNDFCNENDAEFFTVYIPFRGQTRRDPIQDIAQELEASHDIPFLDLKNTPSFSNAEASKSLYFKKDIHLNERGHQAVATHLEEFLNERKIL